MRPSGLMVQISMRRCFAASFWATERSSLLIINGFSDVSERTYRRNGGTDFAAAPCMYVRNVSPKRCYIGKMLIGRAYISGQKSRQVKSENDLTDGRNGFTKSRFSEQESRCAETCGITRFQAKSHGTEKSVGVTYEQDIIPAILNGFDGNRNFYDTAKRMRWRAYLLRCFMI